MTTKDIRDAYVRIRQIDQTIPDEVLDFMKDAAIQQLKRAERIQKLVMQPQSPATLLKEIEALREEELDPVAFPKLKWAIANIQFVYLSMNKEKTAIEANPATHRIAEYVYHNFIKVSNTEQ